jgi:hypothetical protein
MPVCYASPYIHSYVRVLCLYPRTVHSPSLVHLRASGAVHGVTNLLCTRMFGGRAREGERERETERQRREERGERKGERGERERVCVCVECRCRTRRTHAHIPMPTADLHAVGQGRVSLASEIELFEVPACKPVIHRLHLTRGVEHQCFWSSTMFSTAGNPRQVWYKPEGQVSVPRVVKELQCRAPALVHECRHHITVFVSTCYRIPPLIGAHVPIRMPHFRKLHGSPCASTWSTGCLAVRKLKKQLECPQLPSYTPVKPSITTRANATDNLRVPAVIFLGIFRTCSP